MRSNKYSKALVDLLPFVGVEEEVLVLKDGRTALGFELECLEEESLNKASYEGLNQSLAQALGALPSGVLLSRFDAYYWEPYKGEKTTDVRGYFQLRTDGHFDQRPILRHKAYLFVSLGPRVQKAPTPVNTFFSLGKTFYPNPLEGIEGRIYTIKQLGAEIRGTLSTHSLGFKPLSEKTYKELYLQYINLEFSHQPQGVIRSVERHSRGMGLGEKEVRILNLIGQGLRVDHTLEVRGVSQPYLYPLTHALSFPHLLITNYRIEDKEKALKELDIQRLVNRSLGSLGNQSTQLQEEEIAAFTQEIRRKNEAILAVNVCMILWDRAPEELSKKIDLATAAFQKLSGAEVLVEGMDTTNLFFCQAPGNGYQNYRWLRMGAFQGAAYTHFITPYRSQEGMLLCDRWGYPLEVSLFNTRLNNQNAVVVGPTGSGKSFSVGSLIIQRYERGERQIIIDVGGSYKNTIAALRGKYFEYDPQNPISLNPFFCEKEAGSWKIDGDKLIFLITLLGRIWKPDTGLFQAEKASLSRIIPLFYKAHPLDKIPRLIDFVKWLETWAEQEEAAKILGGFDLDQFLLCLSPFTLGQYTEVLNSPAEESLSSYRLICFDMARIKDNPLLFPIVSLLITELALTQIRKHPERKYIYMDEAWSMLSESMGSFVELMYRTIRKNNGAIYIITQGISEILNSGVGEAILSNAETKILLIHTDKQARSRVGEVLGLSNQEEALFASLRKQERSREIFLKQGERARVYSLEVSAHMALALSSTPAVRDKLTELTQQKGGNIHRAISQMIQNG